MSREQDVEESSSEETRDPQYEGWLTGNEVADVTGMSLTSVSRLARQGVLIRERVGQTYLYDPTSISRAKPQESAVDLTAATLAASGQLMRTLTTAVPALIEQVITMAKVHQESTSRLIAQLTERCAVLEAGQTQMLEARESYFDGKAAREQEAASADFVLQQKAKLVEAGLTNLPAIIELGLLALKTRAPADESAPAEEASDEHND